MKTDPILYVERLEDKLTEFIHANGDYLFAVFAFFCLLAVAWLLSRQRKLPPPSPTSARTRAIVGTMLNVGNGKYSHTDFCKIIEGKNRTNAGASVAACGLYLINIEYPSEIFI